MLPISRAHGDAEDSLIRDAAAGKRSFRGASEAGDGITEGILGAMPAERSILAPAPSRRDAPVHDVRDSQADPNRRAAEAWHRAVAAMPVGMAVLDDRGRIVRANDCFGHLLGRDERTLLGTDFASLVLGNDREAWMRNRGEVVRHGRTLVDRERRFFRPDGRMVWLSMSLAPMPPADPGGDPDARIAMALADVSQRRALQDVFEQGQDDLRRLVEQRTAELEAAHLRLRLADRMAAVGTLGAGLGHDMNNVLLPVRAHLNALAGAADEAGLGEHVEAIRQSLAYLQQLADGLHFIALDPERENASDATALDRWLEDVRPILRNAVSGAVALELDVPIDLPPVAVAPHRLTQAVLNLVVNAGEAVRGDDGDGGGTVRLWARPASVPGRLLLGVSDDGPGMSDEVARRAGAMYFTTKSRRMGTGLGLALVRMVAERAGGTMDIRSEPGVGTSVVLTLPLADEAPIDGATR